MLGLLLTRIRMHALSRMVQFFNQNPKLRSALTRNFVIWLFTIGVTGLITYTQAKLYTNFPFSGACKGTFRLSKIYVIFLNCNLVGRCLSEPRVSVLAYAGVAVL